MEPESSLPCSQKAIGLHLSQPCQRINPGPRNFETFCNILHFYSEGLLTPCPMPKLENCPLLFATACSVYLQLPSISEGLLLHPQPEDVPCHGDRDPPNMAPISHLSKMYLILPSHLCVRPTIEFFLYPIWNEILYTYLIFLYALHVAAIWCVLIYMNWTN